MPVPPPAATFTPFDWFLVLMLVVSTIGALARGFIRVLLSLAGLVAGILVASWNYLQVATNLHRWITNYAVDQVLAFLLILALVMALFGWIAALLSRTVRAVGLGFVDRLLGAALGAVRGLLLGVAAMMAVSAFLPDAGWVQNSVLAPYFLDGVDAVSFVVPRHLQVQISTGARHLLHESPELLRPHTQTKQL